MILAFLIVLTYFAYYVYNFYKEVSKHPPGPRPLLLIGNLHQLEAINTHKQFEQWSKIYGPVFTVFFPSPTVIITRLPEIREALIKKGDVFVDRPPGPASEMFMFKDNTGVINSSGPNWREQRRFAIHTLRDFGMGRNMMEEKIMNSVTNMFEQVDGMLGIEAFDMNWPLQLCVGNVINGLLLGYRWRANDCEKFVNFKHTLERVFQQYRDRKSVMLIQTYSWMKHLPIIGYLGWHEVRAGTQKIMDFMAAEIEQHKKTIDYDSEPKDFVSAYLQEMKRREDAGEGLDFLSEDNLTNVLSDFWIAGLETTATTLRWAIVFLIAYPEVQTTMQKEIDEVVGRDRLPTMADKINMPYCTAAVMELQRRANILALNVERYTTADVEVGAHIIPGHTAVFAQITSVMDDPEIFPDPGRFDPSRFLESDGKTFNKMAMDHLVPFSLGKRQCAGEPLARMELFLILVSLLQRYSFSVAEGRQLPDLTPIYGITLVPQPYECKVTLRA